jgi:hypothetical protein
MGAAMTPHILRNVSTWLVNWTLVSNSPPPRDPNDDDDEEQDEEDEEDEDPDKEPPVVREPDE